MQKNKEKEIVMLGILTGLAVMMSYIFAVQTPFVRITFGFLPIAMAGAIYGPWKGGLVAALSDFIGTACLGTSIFFPGFLLSGFLTGWIYGKFFYGHRLTLSYVCIPFFLVMVFIHLGLNTLWLVLYYDKAASAIFFKPPHQKHHLLSPGSGAFHVPLPESVWQDILSDGGKKRSSMSLGKALLYSWNLLLEMPFFHKKNAP